MKNNLVLFKSKVQGYQVALGTYDSKEYLVVPVVMMVEGVHSGSAGSIYHSIDELGKIPAAWDGRPVVVTHPQDSEGNYISANSPSVLDDYAVGYVFNTKVDEDKLKAEAWIDPSKLKKISKDAYESVKKSEVLEVSVGVFTDNEDTQGTWNGEEYSAIAYNHRPDHLALLPGETGACSVEDGCGLGVNKSKKKGGTKLNTNEFQKIFKTLNEQGFSVAEISINKDSYNAIMDALRTCVYAMDDSQNSKYHYVEDVYDSEVIYSSYDNGVRKYYKQMYSFEDGVATLDGEPVEVTKKVEISYDPVVSVNSTRKRTKFNNNQKEVTKMENCIPCKNKVNSLIAHASTHFQEEDRSWLETLEESQLDKLLPKEEKPTPAVNTEVKVEKPAPQVLSSEDQEALNYGKLTLKKQRETYMQGIQSNTAKGTWTDEELAAMSFPMLEKLYTSVYKQESNDGGDVLYPQANRRNVSQVESDFEPLYPLGVNVEVKK